MYIKMDDYKKATSYSNLASEQGKKLRGVDISYLTECMSMWTSPQINESDISSVEEKITEFNTYKEFYSVSKNVGNYEYSVSWIDNFSKYKFQGLSFQTQLLFNLEHLTK